MRKKQTIALILMFFFLESCAGPPALKPPHLDAPTKTAKESPVIREEKIFQKPSTQTQNTPTQTPTPTPPTQNPQTQTPSTGALRTRVILPVIKNPKDNSDMVFIPEGADREKVPLANYYIDKLEITQEQFNHFLRDKKIEKTGEATSCPTCPATKIAFDMAYEYCQWAEKRLPSEMEWLKAAGGGANAAPWPWGVDFEPERANFFGENDGYAAASPVGSFPLGTSEYGVQDMIGNVWEWVSPPYLPDQKNEKKIQKEDGILKGGSWRNLPERVDLFYRHVVNKNLAFENFGFRCAKTF